MLDGKLLQQAKEERDRLLELQHDVERARTDYHHTIRRLHAAGGSLREIADELGLSHQRVHQIIESPAGEQPFPPMMFPPFFGRRGRHKHGPGPFGRFSEEARRVVVLAQEEAQSLRHNYVGTEHLLLGILRLEEGAAVDVLRKLGVGHQQARGQVVTLIGEGKDVRTGRLPFTPRAKKLLEWAFREKRARQARCIEPEHLLLALARDPEAVSTQVLQKLGVTEDAIRAEIDRRLAA